MLSFYKYISWIGYSFIDLKQILKWRYNKYCIQDGGIENYNSTAELLVKVEDVQDKPPTFIGLPYVKTFPENFTGVGGEPSNLINNSFFRNELNWYSIFLFSFRMYICLWQ